MCDEQNGHGTSRLDRPEGLKQLLIDDHLKFSAEHKSLLTSQILLTDRMDKLVGTVENLAGEVEKLVGKDLSGCRVAKGTRRGPEAHRRADECFALWLTI